ncbi:uncharacterized protein METZ01_LOCUS460722 [marine metagenome]|uniref:Uncharacterized protein n=1 Tax=marine metagenome TaxID=408172 RepID=A0A383AL78_9ZZZZ
MAEKKLETFIKTLIDFLEDACDEYDADTIEIFSTALAVCVAGIRRVAMTSEDDVELSSNLMKLGIVWDPDLDDFEMSDDTIERWLTNNKGAPPDETIH